MGKAKGERQRAEEEPGATRRLGDLQAAVLEDLWREGESAVRDVLERLRVRGLDLAYTTVLTVMVRLAARGLLLRRREGRRDYYRAAIRREELSSALSREAVDRLMEVHGDEAIAAFAARLCEGDPARLARLRALLDSGEL